MTRYALPTLVVLIFLAGGVALKWKDERDHNVVADTDTNREDALNQQLLTKALVRNLAASKLASRGAGAVRVVTAEAPPRAADAQAVNFPTHPEAPSPPEGYSFTPYHGEMDQAPFDPELNPPKPQLD